MAMHKRLIPLEKEENKELLNINIHKKYPKLINKIFKSY